MPYPTVDGQSTARRLAGSKAEALSKDVALVEACLRGIRGFFGSKGRGLCVSLVVSNMILVCYIPHKTSAEIESMMLYRVRPVMTDCDFMDRDARHAFSVMKEGSIGL